MQLADIYVRLLSSRFYDYNCFFNLDTTWAFLSCISSCNSASHSTPLMMKSGYLNIGELVHILSDQGRQNIVTALDVAMPAPSLTGTR